MEVLYSPTALCLLVAATLWVVCSGQVSDEGKFTTELAGRALAPLHKKERGGAHKLRSVFSHL